MVIGGLFVLALVVAVVAIVVVVGSMAAITMRKPGGDELYCGNCGYSAKGLPGDRCPECGSDFNLVGLVDRPRGWQWAPLLLVLAWTLLSPVALCVTSVPILSIAPQVSSMNEMRTWRGPSSSAYGWVQIDHSTTSRSSWAGRVSTVRTSEWRITFGAGPLGLVLEGRGIDGPIEVIRRRSAETYNERLSAEFIAGRLAQAFPEADRERLASEASDVHGMIASRLDTRVQEPAMNSFRQYGGGGTNVMTSPAPMVAISILAVAALIWVMGIILIIRWNRRRQTMHS